MAGLESGVLSGSWGVGRAAWKLGGECCSFSLHHQGAFRDVSLLLPRGAKAKGQEMEMGELVSMETGHPVDNGSRVCTRILNSTGQAWQIPRYWAHGQRGPGLGLYCCFLLSVLHPSLSLPHPQLLKKHICSEQLSFQAFLTLA